METLRLCENAAVLGDQVVTGEDEIRGGFALSGIRVNISADKPRGLIADKLPAVGFLACRLIAGGKIGDHGCRCHGMIAGRRNRHPEIFADINAENKIRKIFCRK